MRWIPEERLKEIAHQTHDSDDTNMPVLSLLDMLIAECRELQEPWMTLEEFLESGFEGLCWVDDGGKEVKSRNYFNGRFLSTSTGHQIIARIIKVSPIHKPEPPR